MAWFSVAVPDEAGPVGVVVNGREVVLCEQGGEWAAFDGICPHQGALLGEGEVVNGALVCRNHRWTFDLKSGERLGGKGCLAQFEVRRTEEGLAVRLPEVSQQRAERGVPLSSLPGPRALPVVGNALSLEVRRLHQIFEQWAVQYGPLYGYRVGRERWLAVSDPELITEVLRARPHTYRRYSNLSVILAELNVEGVFNAEGASWRPQRKLAMRALHPSRLKNLFQTIQEVCLRLKERWMVAAQAEEEIDILADLMRFAVDVTTTLAFSEKTNTVGGETSFLLEQLEPIFPLLSRRLNAVFPYWRYVKMPVDRRGDEALEALQRWMMPVVERTRGELDENNITNFLEAMLSGKDENGAPFSDRLIMGNALTMLLAGEDTTSNSLAWIVHLLADDEENTRRTVEEAKRLVGSSGVVEGYASVKQNRWFDAVISESMRLHPVGPVLFMETVCDTVLGGVALKAGTPVNLLTRLSALDPSRVANPNCFDPTRFEDPSVVVALQRSGVFVPFGSGPRICPGRQLAMLEMRMLMAMLYSQFVVERVGDANAVEEQFGFTVSPQNLRVRLKVRGS